MPISGLLYKVRSTYIHAHRFNGSEASLTTPQTGVQICLSKKTSMSRSVPFNNVCAVRLLKQYETFPPFFLQHTRGHQSLVCLPFTGPCTHRLIQAPAQLCSASTRPHTHLRQTKPPDGNTIRYLQSTSRVPPSTKQTPARRNRCPIHTSAFLKPLSRSSTPD